MGYRGDPTSVAALADTYSRIGQTEGVRADWAFAQALVETAGFTSKSWTRDHNPAGIAHYDGQSHGAGFATPQEGITAQIQLLKRFAAGNDVALALAPVAPRAGARATTWAELTGKWATDPRYRATLVAVHQSLVGSTVAGEGVTATSVLEGGAVIELTELCAGPDGGAGPGAGTGPASGRLATVAGITVDSSIAEDVEAMVSAARADGVTLAGSGYRDPQRQIALRRAHCGSSQAAIYEWPSGRCRPPTARPGTSMHERGLAIDFANCSTRSTACWRWLNAYAGGFGFHNLPSEAWHWSTTGG